MRQRRAARTDSKQVADSMETQATALVHRLNEAWQHADWAAVTRCYHPDVILLPPDAGTPIVGRDAVLQTYREFVEMTELHAFEIQDTSAFTFGTTAIVHMAFEVDYTLEGLRSREAGLDVYTIVAQPEPLIVWRNQHIHTHMDVD